MITSTEMMGMLADGLVSATVLLTIAFVLRRFTRVILAFILLGAAIAYISFAQAVPQSVAGPLWMLVECAGVAIYGTMAVLGVRRSAWWLVAGWALHPLWDIPLHFFGPGHAFAPTYYTISCLSFDFLVAGVIALAIVRGWKPFMDTSVEDDAKAASIPAR
jgi:hypothetical protein